MCVLFDHDNFLRVMHALMHFTPVVSELKYHISIPRNLTFYKWCGTKVAHCSSKYSTVDNVYMFGDVAFTPHRTGGIRNCVL